MKKPFIPRADRTDIYRNLPPGGQIEIAKKLNVSKYTVNNVLKGRIKDHHGIIKEAELMAAINIWINRFCKIKKSELKF